MVSSLVTDPAGEVAAQVASLDRREFGASVIVDAELRYGAERRGSARLGNQLNAVLSAIDIYPFDEPADRHYAQSGTNSNGSASRSAITTC